MCKNTGYLVTFSKSSYIALFEKIGLFRREKKGNRVTAILHTSSLRPKNKGKKLVTRQI
jgi:hypothetical protein